MLDCLETAQAVNLVIGIEHLSISINMLNTTSIKWNMNRFGVVLKFAACAMTFVPLNKASHHTGVLYKLFYSHGCQVPT